MQLRQVNQSSYSFFGVEIPPSETELSQQSVFQSWETAQMPIAQQLS